MGAGEYSKSMMPSPWFGTEGRSRFSNVCDGTEAGEDRASGELDDDSGDGLGPELNDWPVLYMLGPN